MNIYGYGSRGEAVKKIQRRLGLSPDGIFGRNTKNAVIRFQKSNKLKPDGMVGPNTWNLMFKTNTVIRNNKVTVHRKKVVSNTTNKSIIDVANHVISTYKQNGVKYSQRNRQFGLSAKYADCSSTIHTILKESGCDDKLSSTNTRAMRSEISSKGGKFRNNNPLPGDIMMWGGHVTLVTKVENGLVYFAHMGGSGPRIGRVRLNNGELKSENTWGSGGFIGFWTIS